MQTKLAKWSKDQSFKFDDIYNIVYDQDFLYESWVNVKSNRGSTTPGVDGTVAEDYAEDLQGNLKGLRQRLKSGSYRPKPVRRTYIPKGNGEERPLGIPTIEDRIVQESLRLALEPIYETDFSKYSFGFRPNRGCHDAINLVQQQMAPAAKCYKHWVLDLDVKGYFDNVDHITLMYIIKNRVTDKDVQQLIWDTLKAGVKEDGTVHATGKGTPQGGIVSPLLANIYLNELDQWVKHWTEESQAERKRRKRRGKGSYSYIRYADDFIILTNAPRHHAERMKERVEDFLDDKLCLELSEEKSSITHAQDGINFLGYNMEACLNTGGTDLQIPKEAEDYIRDRVKEATSGGNDVSASRKVRAINRVVNGWANYYKYCTDAAKVFNDLDELLWHRVTKWLCRKFECSRRSLIRKRLDNHSPITIGGRELVDLSGKTSRYTKSPFRHDHPYLEQNEVTPQGEWGKPYNEAMPEDPYLANVEERDLGVVEDVRNRDQNRCQVIGCGIGGAGKEKLPVHHIRRRRSEDDDRPENMVVVCRKHHYQIHRPKGEVQVHHRGKDEKLKLS